MTDQIKKLGAVWLVFVFSLACISAITTNPSAVYLDQTFTDNPSQNVKFTNLLNQTLTLTLSSELQNIVDLSFSTAYEGQSTTLTINPNALPGTYSGTLNYGESIPIYVHVLEEQIYPSSCQIRPSIVEYNQDYQQGAQGTETITFDPQNCDGDIDITGVIIQGGVVDSSGKRKPVSKGTISSNEINFNIDTEGLPSKTYDGIKLTFNAYGTQHTIKFNIGVTGSAGGSGDFNINNLPTCSLTSNSINLNQTHSLVCSNLAPDVEIVPRVDSKYIRGLDKQVEANQFTWIFEAKDFGKTTLFADFYYQNVPVGDPFEQDISISASGTQTFGTVLKFKFTPELSELDGSAVIQIVDNSSDSLVNNPVLLINAEEVNRTGAYSFNYIFESGKNYELRAKVEGYNDLVKIINLTNKNIEIKISPQVGDPNTLFNITTKLNATLKINGQNVSNPYYGNLVGGINFIEASKDGYSNTLNFTVTDYLRIISGANDVKKGKELNITINKNSTYTVYYKKDLDSQDKEVVSTGTGELVTFTPKKSGFYSIEADGYSSSLIEVKGFSLNDKLWKFKIWMWLIGLVVLIVIIFLIVKARGSGEIDREGLNMSVGNA